MRALLLLLIASLLTACPGRARDDDDNDDNDDSAADDDDAGIEPDDDDSTEPECVDDAFEENDEVEAARALTAGSYQNLQACPFDHDWYQVTVPAGFRLTVQAVFSHAQGDVDLVLQSADGVLLSSSFSQTDNELVGPQLATSTSTYFIDVRLIGFGGDPPGNRYGLSLLVEPGQ